MYWRRCTASRHFCSCFRALVNISICLLGFCRNYFALVLALAQDPFNDLRVLGPMASRLLADLEPLTMEVRGLVI